MSRRAIFLEAAFWDWFSECFRALLTSTDEMDAEKITRWNQLFKFICRSDVFIDAPLHILGEKAKTDKVLWKLLKRNGDGQFDLNSKDPFPDLESSRSFDYDTDYQSVFFTKIDHNEAARRHGVINISADTIWAQENKFKDTGSAISRGEYFSWGSMEDILHEASTGMVAVDNYFMKLLNPMTDRNGTRLSLAKNLEKLINLMLPENCDKFYYISIFYLDAGRLDERQRKRNMYSCAIENFVKRTRPKLRFELELFPTDGIGDFHDRAILTNNVWIGCEGGFDVIKGNRSQKSTKFHCLYLGFGNEAAKWLDQSCDDLIRDAKEVIERMKYSTNNKLLQ